MKSFIFVFVSLIVVFQLANCDSEEEGNREKRFITDKLLGKVSEVTRYK